MLDCVDLVPSTVQLRRLPPSLVVSRAPVIVSPDVLLTRQTINVTFSVTTAAAATTATAFAALKLQRHVMKTNRVGELACLESIPLLRHVLDMAARPMNRCICASRFDLVRS